MTRLRHVFKDTLIYGLGDLIFRGSAVIAMPLYTRIFSPAEYGVWSFVLVATGLLNAVLILGGDSAYARYYFAAKEETERARVTSSALIFLGLWAALVALAVVPLSGLLSQWSFGTSAYAMLFALAIVTAPLTIVNAIAAQALRNQFRARLFSQLNVAAGLLTLSLSIAGAFRFGLIGVFIGAVAAAALMLPIRLWAIRDLLRPAVDAGLIKQLLGYGLPLVPASLAYWVFNSSDRLVLGKLSTLGDVGLYAVAATLIGMLTLLNGAIGQAWSPHAMKLYEHDPRAASALAGKALTYIVAVFGLLAVGLTAFAQEILGLFAASQFRPAAIAVGPLALGMAAYATTQVTALGFSLTRRTGYIAVFSWLAALLNLGLNMLLIPKWGFLAAAWTTAAAFAFLSLAYGVVSQRLYAIAYEGRKLVLGVSLTIAFVLGAPHLPGEGLIAALAVQGVYCAVFLAALFLGRVLEPEAWSQAVRMVKERVAGKSAASSGS